MGRIVSRVTQVAAGVLLAGTTSAYAENLAVSVDDARRAETSSGLWILPVAVKLPSPPTTSDVSVNWSLVAGTASAPSDFVMASGTLNFRVAFLEDTKFINVQINGDINDEWSPTLQRDEVFFIEISTTAPNAFIAKGRGTVTLIDDDHSNPGLQFLAAVSGGTGGAGQNKLHWRVPAAPTQPSDIRIRWNSGSGCIPPSSTTSPLSGLDIGDKFFVADFLQTINGPGAVQSWVHAGRTLGLQYCYSLWTYYAGVPTMNSERMMVKSTPFDASVGRIAWRYTPGCYQPWPCASAALAPPTVGMDAIYAVDNVGVVHAMRRGDSGGVWPTPDWSPLWLGKPTQSRSPVVPFGSNWRLFVGTDGGGMHAVDARYGNLIWSRSADFAAAGSPALPNTAGSSAQAPTAGLFKAYGAQNDMLLVGTNNGLGNNSFIALNPDTGMNVGSFFTDAAMGNVMGMAVVDYALPNRVYFLTSSSNTLYALDTGPMGSPGLAPSSLGWNPQPFGGSSGAPVMRGNRIYLGDNGGQIHALHLDGTTYFKPTNDGNAKGFLWPDRRSGYLDRLYVSTDTKVHGFRDDGSMLSLLWSVSVNNPSMVLQKPGSDFLYVGNANGELVQINAFDQTTRQVALEPGTVQIGAPSLDGPNSIIIVGSMSGTIHAVRVPLP